MREAPQTNPSPASHESNPWSAEGHETVLLREAVENLAPFEGGTFVDATFGGGGHTAYLLDTRPPVGRVLALDADTAAAARADRVRAGIERPERFSLHHANFRDLATVVHDAGFDRVNGVLFDLGVSSYQFDEGERGFSFRFDAPLDMRFDRTRGRTAADLVNQDDQAELARVFWEYGDERRSRQIAGAIIREREQEPILGTQRLAQIVERAVGGRRGAPIHPATRTFQALRIAVNDELTALSDGLGAAVDLLTPGGRLVVISFHSLEDRLVKRFIEAQSRTCVCPPDQPVCTCDTTPALVRVGKPIRATSDETERNPRSRSAIMRVAERLNSAGERASSQGSFS